LKLLANERNVKGSGASETTLRHDVLTTLLSNERSVRHDLLHASTDSSTDLHRSPRRSVLQRRSLQQWTTQLPLMRHDLLTTLLVQCHSATLRHDVLKTLLSNERSVRHDLLHASTDSSTDLHRRPRRSVLQRRSLQQWTTPLPLRPHHSLMRHLPQNYFGHRHASLASSLIFTAQAQAAKEQKLQAKDRMRRESQDAAQAQAAAERKRRERQDAAQAQAAKEQKLQAKDRMRRERQDAAQAQAVTGSVAKEDDTARNREERERKRHDVLTTLLSSVRVFDVACPSSSSSWLVGNDTSDIQRTGGS